MCVTLLVPVVPASASSSSLRRSPTAAFCLLPTPTRRPASSLSMMAGSSSKKKKTPQQPSTASPFSLFAFGGWGEKATPDTKKKAAVKPTQKKKKKEKEEKGWFSFTLPFSSSSKPSSSKEKPKQKEKEEKGGWFGWGGGFKAFNSEWKDQLSLQKKIKKLEKEVARDYLRGDKARAAQYRYDVLQTLDEIEQQQTTSSSSSSSSSAYDPILAGKTQRSQQLEAQDARLLQSNPTTHPPTTPVKPEVSTQGHVGSEKGLPPESAELNESSFPFLTHFILPI